MTVSGLSPPGVCSDSFMKGPAAVWQSALSDGLHVVLTVRTPHDETLVNAYGSWYDKRFFSSFRIWFPIIAPVCILSSRWFRSCYQGVLPLWALYVSWTAAAEVAYLSFVFKVNYCHYRYFICDFYTHSFSFLPRFAAMTRPRRGVRLV